MSPSDVRHLLASTGYRMHLDGYTHVPPARPRFAAFMLFAHEVFGWFEADPALACVKLTCVTVPEIQRQPLHVRLRHHFALTSERDGPPRPLVEDVDRYVMEHLPWQSMSQGSCTLRRNDAHVGRFLALPPHEQAGCDERVFALASAFDFAFAEVELAHDIGWASAG